MAHPCNEIITSSQSASTYSTGSKCKFLSNPRTSKSEILGMEDKTQDIKPST